MSEMIMRGVFLLVITLVLAACTDTEAMKKKELLERSQKDKQLFEQLSSNWDFKPVDFTEDTYQIVHSWAEWNIFYTELLQKPQFNLDAFRLKINTLVKQSEDMQSTIPEVFNTVEIQSRFVVLDTKLQMLKTYLRLDEIPMDKVLFIRAEITVEIDGIAKRMKAILDKRQRVPEEGEQELLRKSLEHFKEEVFQLQEDFQQELEYQ
ncbi:MAG: hypothetical protein Q4B43_01650 [Bacteroidota bacterium]|nr:hypothetical protein [Bacteroidota bacterium]